MRGIRNSDGEIVKAGCVVVDTDLNVLLVTSGGQSTWSYPKGHIETGESARQAAIREVLEETGYEVKIMEKLEPELTYTNEETHEPIRLSLYLARPLQQRDGSEEEFEWVSLEKAKQLIYPNLRPYLDGIMPSR